MSKYATHWHIRIDNLSEKQYQQFIDNTEYVQWMLIGNKHCKNCYGINDPRNGIPHYHVVLKYNNSRQRMIIVNKFILNKDKKCESYYVEPMYTHSNERALINYVSDKEAGIRFTYGRHHIAKYLDTTDDIIEEPQEIVPKVSKVQEKINKNLERLEHAKNCNWTWFETNDFEFMLSPKFNKLYERYNTLDINKYLHLAIKGDTRKRFFILFGESRKGKGEWVKWFTRIMNLEYYYFNKTDDYFNGAPSDHTDWFFHVDEWDASYSCIKTMPVSTIKEVFDKMPKKVRAAYCFDKVMRFGYGGITMQVNPKRAFFAEERQFVEENWLAISNRFSVINVNLIPKLFSLTFNVEEEIWEQKELNKVPIEMAQRYPWLVDENGYPIYKEEKWLNKELELPSTSEMIPVLELPSTSEIVKTRQRKTKKKISIK